MEALSSPRSAHLTCYFVDRISRALSLAQAAAELQLGPALLGVLSRQERPSSCDGGMQHALDIVLEQTEASQASEAALTPPLASHGPEGTETTPGAGHSMPQVGQSLCGPHDHISWRQHCLAAALRCK